MREMRDTAETKREDSVRTVTYSEPLVVENLLDGDPMIYVGREHSLYKVFRRLANGIPEWCLHLQIQLNRNYSPRSRGVSRRGRGRLHGRSLKFLVRFVSSGLADVRSGARP